MDMSILSVPEIFDTEKDKEYIDQMVKGIFRMSNIWVEHYRFYGGEVIIPNFENGMKLKYQIHFGNNHYYVTAAHTFNRGLPFFKTKEDANKVCNILNFMMNEE